jgi:hypothetical protein
MPTINSLLPPYPTFRDAQGNPLNGGYVYIGQPGLEARTTPKASFFDEGLTIPTGTASGAAVRTSAGYPVGHNGSPANVYVDGDYSITVLNSAGVMVFSSLYPTFALDTGAAVGAILAPDGNLSATGFGFISEPDTGFIRPVPQTMQTVVDGVLVAQATTTGTAFLQPVSGAGFTDAVAALIAAQAFVVGEIRDFLLPAVPTGWLNLNGSTIGNVGSGATTASLTMLNLFTALWAFADAVVPIQTSGGGASTRGASAAADWAALKRIVLTDFRGEFRRTADQGRGIDAARVLGSAQLDAFQGHWHQVTASEIGGSGGSLAGTGNAGSAGGAIRDDRVRAAFTDGTSGTPRTAAETRPRNIAVLTCIKF